MREREEKTEEIKYTYSFSGTPKLLRFGNVRRNTVCGSQKKKNIKFPPHQRRIFRFYAHILFVNIIEFLLVLQIIIDLGCQ